MSDLAASLKFRFHIAMLLPMTNEALYIAGEGSKYQL
jgi:hypothetical protein